MNTNMFGSRIVSKEIIQTRKFKVLKAFQIRMNFIACFFLCLNSIIEILKERFDVKLGKSDIEIILLKQ